MLGSASRAALRSPASRQLLIRQPPRRFISLAPPSQKSRSWKSSALRWGLAAGGLYYYSTSGFFSEDDAVTYTSSYLSDTERESNSLPTLDTLLASRKQRLALASPSTAQSTPSSQPQQPMSSNLEAAAAPSSAAPELDPNSPEALEEEAEGEGAFNPETGEINWDCPCLGGMAHGPCGPDFREAFSCFVYSKVEPKGMDCIEHFKKMQDCFRAHPDVYGAELADDDDYDEDPEDAPPNATRSPESNSKPENSTSARPPSPSTEASSPKPQPAEPASSESRSQSPPTRRTLPAERLSNKSSEAATGSKGVDDSVPEAWHDARSANAKAGKDEKSSS